MFRKTYDSLSTAVHVEFLLDKDKACIKTWLEVNKRVWDIQQEFKDKFEDGWKYSATGNSGWSDVQPGINPWSLDMIRDKKDYDGNPVTVKHIERSLDIPKSPAIGEWPAEVSGIYHKYLPAGRIMGQTVMGEQFLPNMPERYRSDYIDRLTGKYFMGTSFAWLDLTDPSIFSGEKDDAACWVIGIDYEGNARPAFNSVPREKDTKAHPLRASRHAGRPACLFVYQPFSDVPFDECSITLKYNKGYGFSTNAKAAWVDGTNEKEMLATSGKDYNYVGQMYEAFPKFVVTSGGNNIAADGTDTVEFKMVDNDGKTIEKDIQLFLEATGGYLPKQRLITNKGVGTFKVTALGLTSGEKFKVKIGFRNYTGVADVDYTVD